MGRPLKIKQSTTIDIGFNSFANLDPSTQVIPAGMSSSEYLGVVGGGFPSGIATPTYPTVACTAYFTDGADEQDAYIITQKGQTKYLVAAANGVNAGTFTVGQSYVIQTLGTTNWAACGASTVNAQIGDVFTATTAGNGNGTAGSVAVCTLVNLAAGDLTDPGTMQVTATCNGDSFQVSKMTNKYVWDYQTPAVKYAANFFDGAGGLVATAASGADVATWDNGSGNYALAEVTDYTS